MIQALGVTIPKNLLRETNTAQVEVPLPVPLSLEDFSTLQYLSEKHPLYRGKNPASLMRECAFAILKEESEKLSLLEPQMHALETFMGRCEAYPSSTILSVSTPNDPLLFNSQLVHRSKSFIENGGAMYKVIAGKTDDPDVKKTVDAYKKIGTVVTTNNTTKSDILYINPEAEIALLLSPEEIKIQFDKKSIIDKTSCFDSYEKPNEESWRKLKAKLVTYQQKTI